MSEDSLSDDVVEVDLGDTVMLERTGDDEVAQRSQSGIWFYLRSDLARALTLFVVTIALAIITTRLQRQMEAEGI